MYYNEQRTELDVVNLIYYSIENLQGKGLDVLSKHPDYTQIGWNELGDIIKTSVRNKVDFSQFMKHSNYDKIRGDRLGRIIETSIQKGVEFSKFMQHHNCNQITESQLAKIIEASIQKRVEFSKFMEHPNYNNIKTDNLLGLIRTSVCNSGHGFEELFKALKKRHDYENIGARDVFDLIRTSILNGGHGFEELFKSLEKHENYNFIKQRDLLDLIYTSISNRSHSFEQLFKALKEHKNYENIEAGHLYNLIDLSISKDAHGFEQLIQHPKFNGLSKNHVLSLMNAAREANLPNDKLEYVINKLETHISMLTPEKLYKMEIEKNIQGVYFDKSVCKEILNNGLIKDENERFSIFSQTVVEYMRNSPPSSEIVGKLCSSGSIFHESASFAANPGRRYDGCVERIKFDHKTSESWLDILNTCNKANNQAIKDLQNDAILKGITDRIVAYSQSEAFHQNVPQRAELSLREKATVAQKLEHLLLCIKDPVKAEMKESKQEALQPKGYKDERDLQAAIANLAQNVGAQNAQQQQQLDNTPRVRSRSANLRSS